ncbi:MAG: VOC family protein, partial [Acetobacteraceae bacterium]|nr:VOC family protein [Acetobacteraceae bacterium]
VCIGTNDLPRATRFYEAVLTPLGLVRRPSKDPEGMPYACWRAPGTKVPSVFVAPPFDGHAASVGNGSMVAFLAPSPEAVAQAHAAGLAAGGSDEGPPGERPHYAQGYYGAYLRDPDGNKIHVVHRGDLAG